MASRKRNPQNQKSGMLVEAQVLTFELAENLQMALPGNSQEELNTLKTHMESEFQVTTQAERALIQQMAQTILKKQQLRQYESLLLEVQTQQQEWQLEKEWEQKKTSHAMQELEIEIRELKKHLEEIEECLKDCYRLNRIRDKKKFRREAKWQTEFINDTVQNAFKATTSFIDTLGIMDAQKEVPQSYDGEFFRGMVTLSVIHESAVREKRRVYQPISTYSLERCQCLLKERLERKESKRAGFHRAMEIERLVRMAGIDLVLEETTLAKLQRYEAILDNQFYKAVQELQKLQVFLIQKNKTIEKTVGFFPQKGTFSNMIEVNPKLPQSKA